MLQTSPVRVVRSRADDDEIDQPVLHEMAAGVVGDHRMRHPFAQQFESGEARALIARARLIDPDMDRDSGARRLVNRRQRRPPVDGREPARVAMGEDVHRATGIPVCRCANQPRAVIADGGAAGDVLLGDPRRLGIGQRARAPAGAASSSARTRSSAQRRLTAVGRVASSVS